MEMEIFGRDQLKMIIKNKFKLIFNLFIQIREKKDKNLISDTKKIKIPKIIIFLIHGFYISII